MYKLSMQFGGDYFYTIRDPPRDPPHGDRPSYAPSADPSYVTTEQLFTCQANGAFPSEVVIFNNKYNHESCLNRLYFERVGTPKEPEQEEEEEEVDSKRRRGSEILSRYTLLCEPDQGEPGEDHAILVPNWELNHSQPDFASGAQLQDWSSTPGTEHRGIFSNAYHFEECSENGRDWKSYVVLMRAGLFHPKLYFLRFDDEGFLRVIVSSRNLEGLLEADVCWVTDLPVSPRGDNSEQWYQSKIESSVDAFIKPLDDFFKAVCGSRRDVYLRVRHVFRGVRSDAQLCSPGIQVAFIASLGALSPPRRSQPPLAVLRDRLRSLKWSGGDAAASNLIVTSCFLGSVEALSWSNFLSACGVSEGDCRLIFPSYRDVYETDETDGWNKMHLFVGKEATHGTMTHLDTLLHRAVLRDRRALWHIKMYCRFPSDGALEAATQGSGTLAWVLLGSHNCSEASFGTLAQGGNNVEASVLMSTSRSDTAREWQRRHPFDLAACVRYKGRYTRHGTDDEIYTWGRSPFMFAERYGHGKDDRGDASWHSLDQLKKMKENFYTERRNERSR